MDGTIIGIAAVIALGAALFAGAFVMLSVVPLLGRLRKMSAEAEKLLHHLNGELPGLLKQTTQTLKNLDGTLVENLPALIARTTGTLKILDGSLSTELPSLIRETTHTVRNLNDNSARPG